MKNLLGITSLSLLSIGGGLVKKNYDDKTVNLGLFLGALGLSFSLPLFFDSPTQSKIAIDNLNEAKAYIQSLSYEEYIQLKGELEDFISKSESEKDDGILIDGMDIMNDFRGNDVISDDTIRSLETDIIISNIKKLDDERESIFDEMEEFSSKQKTR